MKFTRYRLGAEIDSHYELDVAEYEHPEGEWVKSEDVEKLELENDNLEENNSVMKQEIEELKQLNAEMLKAIEKLYVDNKYDEDWDCEDREDMDNFIKRIKAEAMK